MLAAAAVVATLLVGYALFVVAILQFFCLDLSGAGGCAEEERAGLYYAIFIWIPVSLGAGIGAAAATRALLRRRTRPS